MTSLRQEITKTLMRLAGGQVSSLDRPTAPYTPDLRAGKQYGEYRIQKAIGSGGMGRVYLALDTRLGRHVAIKFLPPELSRDPEFVRRFEQEARAASALSHPNVVTIFDFKEIDGEALLVTEYIEGVTLRHLLDHGDVTPEHAVSIAVQVASALNAAHGYGIVHRDLKPSNIMLRPDGYVKVIDFGLAKVALGAKRDPASREMTLPGVVLGTVDYLSPEQARGDKVDARTDLWSLGVVLYEMLAHDRPFKGETDSHVVVDICDREPAPLPTKTNLPLALARVVHRALQKDAKKRYQTAAELLNDLRVVGGDQILPTPSPNQRSNRRGLVLSAAVLVFTLGMLAFWWWGMDGRARMMGPKWFDFSVARRATFEGDVRNACISPDGKFLAYVSGPQLRLEDVASATTKSITATPGECLGLTFSPDSKTLYYVLSQNEIGRVFSVPVATFGSTPSQILFEHADGPVTFSPSGQEFAYVLKYANGSQMVNSIRLADSGAPLISKPIVTYAGTQIKPELAWGAHDEWIGAINYPNQLNGPTRATFSLFRPNGAVIRSYVPEHVRSLWVPTALDGGNLVLFAGVPQGAWQRHLVQLYTPSGEFRETVTDMLGFEALSATADSKTLAALRLEQRSSIWEADVRDLQHPVKRTGDAEPIPSARWIGDGRIVYPSARTGHVMLSVLNNNGAVAPLGRSGECIERQPSAAADAAALVYSSNCARGADDFNLWLLDPDTGRRRQLTAGATYDWQPDISRDGKWVVYASWLSDSPSLWKVPTTGGLPMRISDRQAQYPYWSPDGQTIVVQMRDRTGLPWQVQIVNGATGEVLRRFPALPVDRRVSFSPDGKSLDYIDSQGGISGLWRQSLDGGAPVRLLTIDDDSISDFDWSPDGTKVAFVKTRTQRDVFLLLRKQTY